MQASEMTALVQEAFLSRLLPFNDEVTLAAIRNLRMEDYPSAAVYAGLGALAASIILYGIGIWLRRMPDRFSTDTQQARVEYMRATANEWLPWLLVLSASPIGGMLIIAAGFFAVKPWKVATMLVVAEIAWRAAPLI